MSDKLSLDFQTISRAMKTMALPEVDLVVGVATGGSVPACLIAHQIERPLRLMHINFRAQDNTPRHSKPMLISWQPLQEDSLRILLVDEVSVTGQTLEFARTLLDKHQVLTFVLKGKADYVLFPNVDSCVNWPWKMNG